MKSLFTSYFEVGLASASLVSSAGFAEAISTSGFFSVAGFAEAISTSGFFSVAASFFVPVSDFASVAVSDLASVTVSFYSVLASASLPLLETSLAAGAFSEVAFSAYSLELVAASSLAFPPSLSPDF